MDEENKTLSIADAEGRAEERAAAALDLPGVESWADEVALPAPSAQTVTASEDGGAVRVDMQLTPVVNYAQQQNGLPVLRRLDVTSCADLPLENVELRLSSPEGFIRPATFYIAELPPRGSVEASGAEVVPNASLLASLTERAAGTIVAEVWAGGELLGRAENSVTFLAFDEWHGADHYPELLASFVTPNHPAVTRVLTSAAGLLEQWTGDPSFDAYQTQNPNRVLRQAAAIYTAIQQLNIVYAEPPASFETSGQRVRMCDALTSAKLATCLDMTLFYASCLEAAGLHPLILLSRGHAFGGVWLEQMTFQEAVRDDPSLVSKRMAEGIAEIAVLDPTGMCAGRDRSFDEARADGAAEVNGGANVRLVLDVHRARLAGIRPLPQRVQSDQGWVVEERARPREELSAAPEDLAERVDESSGNAAELDAREKKIRVWERKLLDLGLRNSLINLRAGKSLIPVLSPSLPQLEDSLFDGRQYTIEPAPQEWHISDEALRSLEPPAELPGGRELLVSEAANGRLRSLMNENALKAAVKDLYRAARTAIEENGANSLYLSLGLLRWYETERSERARYAPLVLLPVEIVRKAANKGYCLRLRDEDAVMNVTLLEMLRQNFGIEVAGLDPLPADEHGVDVVRVFTLLRRAVMQQKRWDVVEAAFVGIFSFSRFVMWNDIRNRMDDLKKNKVVQSLMDGRLSWQAPPLDPDQELDEGDLLLPLPVDASQLYAIKEAVAGETFVLHGPPGTGKSQTITGLIINLLARGKTVLFVAEKMAALSVVQKRLRKLGLDPFCLELHSNKARKKDVLDQLKAATEIAHGTPSQVYARDAENAARLRGELSSYPHALHQARTSGMSVFEMIGAYEPLSAVDDAGIRFDYDTAASWTGADLERRVSLLKSLCAAASAVGHPHGHALRLVTETDYSQKLRSTLPPLLPPYQKSLVRLERAVSSLSAALGMTVPQRKREFKKLRDIAVELAAWKDLPRVWAKAENAASLTESVSRMARHYLAAGETAGRLLKNYRATFLDLDGEALRTEWNAIQGKWALMRMFAESGFVKKLSSYAHQPRSKEAVPADLDALIQYRAERDRAQSLWTACGGGLEEVWGASPDWQKVLDAAQAAGESAVRLDALFGAELRRRFAGDAAARAEAEKLLSAWNETTAARRALNAVLRVREPAAGELWLDEQLGLCAALEEHADELRDWIAWNDQCAQCEEAGLGAVVAAYQSGLAHERVLPAARKALLRALIEDAVDNDAVLGRFSGAVFDEKIRQLKALIDELSQLCKQEAYNTLAAKVPNFAREASQNSELGILQRAIRSGGRNLSIRRLFEQLPNLLPRLCPCMLMSPISAAQYLDPRREMFDYVVFDEASQLTTSKAVGALARGRNAVIVGDPRQMPPTSFFMTNTDEGEEDPQLADLTSILDDCLALGLPETHLLWHYRSTHESLIAFSNNQFYENKLYTFPSVNDRISKVSFVHVDGRFDRGRTRSNRAEAEAVVAEVIRRAKDPQLKNESIGIVTFNIGQQNLIDDLFEEARGRDLELEKWYQQSAEPLFIKNLENVQGDERDVILFSIGFGADRDGKVSMNFGPINQAGGWRRLNVAVSRSRTEMKVFSSLLPEQIDLGRTSSEGVAALKAFLQYARTGYLPERAVSAPGPRQRPHSDGVAEQIRAELKAAGYDTVPRVGHSKFKIDIGVIDPDQPDEYLLGILLDGETYKNARTVRDREIAQIGVLKGLGWNIERTWTMDWWDNKKREMSRLIEQVEALRRACQEQREAKRQAEEAAARAAAEEAARAAAAATEAEAGAGSDAPAEDAEAARDKEPVAVSAAQAVEAPAPAADDAAEPEPDDPAAVSFAGEGESAFAAPAETNSRPYHAARLSERRMSAAEFLEKRNEKTIVSRLETIIAEEAPISLRLLTRRLLQSLGMSRLGPRAQERLDSLISRLDVTPVECEETVFYWKNGDDPNSCDWYRVSGTGLDKRDAADVPPQEAAAAVIDVLRAQVALPGADCVRETAKLLGYTRMGSNVSAAASAGLALATRRGDVTLDRNGSCVLVNE